MYTHPCATVGGTYLANMKLMFRSYVDHFFALVIASNATSTPGTLGGFLRLSAKSEPPRAAIAGTLAQRIPVFAKLLFELSDKMPPGIPLAAL